MKINTNLTIIEKKQEFLIDSLKVVFYYLRENKQVLSEEFTLLLHEKINSDVSFNSFECSYLSKEKNFILKNNENIKIIISSKEINVYKLNKTSYSKIFSYNFDENTYCSYWKKLGCPKKISRPGEIAVDPWNQLEEAIYQLIEIHSCLSSYPGFASFFTLED